MKTLDPPCLRRRTSSGRHIPNAHTLPFFGFGKSISFVGWNARALIHHEKHLRDSKLREVFALCKEFDVVALCEVHGEPAAMVSLLALCRRTHHLLYSHVRFSNGEFNFAAGGICLLVNKRLFPNSTPLLSVSIILLMDVLFPWILFLSMAKRSLCSSFTTLRFVLL